jgi:alanine dehydrogenase
MSDLTMGVIGTSRKENEHRKPIHPDHLRLLPDELCRRLVFEHGYGEPFGVNDDEMAARSGGVATRETLLGELGVVILPKPLEEDLRELRENGILWGWPHCVQQRGITQAAIERRLTLIAFEEMFEWTRGGLAGLHTFYKNNEMAGYCGVLHALQLKGIDGFYGNQRKVLVFSLGGVSRGALNALIGRGFKDITICTQRPVHAVREDFLGYRYVQMRRGGEGEARMMVEHEGAALPLIDLIADADILVNGILQDPNRPLMYLTDEELPALKPGSLIIDVSCDAGMGFPFARPTSFEDPMFRAGATDYYAVDHTPTYLWESATRAISEALIVHLPAVMAGRESWQQHETVRRAVEIDEGVIQKPAILAFQKRQPHYPHAAAGG